MSQAEGESSAQHFLAARAAAVPPRARRHDAAAHREPPRHGRRADGERAHPRGAREPAAHVVAPSQAPPRRHRSHDAGRARGALLARRRSLRRASDADLSPPRESGRGDAVTAPQHGIVPDTAARRARAALAPLARGLARAGITPNAVTVAGLVLSLAGALLVVTAGPGPGFVVLALGAIADSLDGQLARLSGRASVFGSFLDSTLDRVSDAAPLLAAAVVGAHARDDALLGVALWAIVVSSLVPYARAKAESLGLTAAVGLAPREARTALVVLGVALWWLSGDARAFTIAIAGTAALATITVLQRIAYVARQDARNT